MSSKGAQSNVRGIAALLSNVDGEHAAGVGEDDSGTTWMSKAFICQRPPVRVDRQHWAVDLWRTRPSAAGDCQTMTLCLVSTAPLPWIQQVGPTCGLAAISMAALQPPTGRIVPGSVSAHSAFLCLPAVPECFAAVWPGPVDTDDLSGSTADYAAESITDRGERLLMQAIDAGYTHVGEMFSAKHLELLARTSLRLRCRTVPVASRDDVIVPILQGGYLLMAFDSGPDHQPCHRAGQSAHWVICVGVGITENGTWFVVAQHGKGRLPIVMEIDALLRSNAQLVGPLTCEQRSAYRLHNGDIDLAGLAVLVEPHQRQ
ncbi:hypothetical protein PBRA_008637 [Plasmodiophora brassicae]|nr:hypothetical protein PBRA_008637 [Plasmodiophora brassicae]